MLTPDFFGSFYYSPSHFQFFSYSSHVGETVVAFFEAASLSGYSKPKFADEISFFVSRGSLNKIYGSTTRKVSVTFSTNYGTDYGDSIFIVGSMTSWSINTDYILDWYTGNDWSKEFTLPVGAEIKIALASSGGGGVKKIGNWFQSHNHPYNNRCWSSKWVVVELFNIKHFANNSTSYYQVR